MGDSDELKGRLVAGALIAASVYFDPLSAYLGNPINYIAEGFVAGFLGGEISSKIVYGVPIANKSGSLMGVLYGICGALGGLLASYTGNLGPLVAAASVMLDTTVGPYLGPNGPL